MVQMDTWIDITTTIYHQMVHWPDDIPVHITRTSSMNIGAQNNVTALQMSAHTGTHIDAPCHFINEGKDITHVSLNKLMGQAKLFSFEHTMQITSNELKDLPISKGDRILFKTRNSDTDWSRQPFQTNFVHLSVDAAWHLKNKEVACIGVDYLSIGDKEVHQILLSDNVAIIEGLNLHGISEGNYEMICLPLKISGADAAPARAIIRRI
jgi:arylformamidase